MKLKEWRGKSEQCPAHTKPVHVFWATLEQTSLLGSWVSGLVSMCRQLWKPALEEAADMEGRRGSRKRLSLSAANRRLTRAARKIYWFMNSNQNA